MSENCGVFSRLLFGIKIQYLILMEILLHNLHFYYRISLVLPMIQFCVCKHRFRTKFCWLTVM